MSIPGLGHAGVAATPASRPAAEGTSTTSSVVLQPFWEYRFEVPLSSSLTIRLTSGIAEKDGTELAPQTPYTFAGTKSKINTWHGCELEVSAPNGANQVDAYVAEPSAEETPMVSYLNLHMKLEGMRVEAANRQQMGPRVLVVGPPGTGKTTVARTLASWASRMGRQPLVVNTDPVNGMLSLPGTLSAAVFTGITDVTTDWGGIPSSGPAAVPVKLPLAYYYGLQRAESNPRLFRSLVNKLAVASTSRLAQDLAVQSSGMIVDTTSVTNTGSKEGYELLAHIAAELSVNIIIVLGSERMSAELSRRFAGQRTSIGDEVAVVGLEKSGGVVESNAEFSQGSREALIREYFFGDAKRTLSPFTQTVPFEGVTIWRVVEAPSSFGDADDFYVASPTLERTEPSVMMLNCVLAVTYASTHDSAEQIRDTNIMGFVYVSDVDDKRKRLKLLAPVSAKLGDRPLIWGSWPEPMVSLLD